MKNPREEKPWYKERELPLNQRDYKEVSALCYRFNYLGFDPLPRRRRLAFITEG